MNYPFYSQPYPPMPQQSFMAGRPTYMDTLQQNSQYLSIKGRPVTSYDEAKASMIDFDGSVFYFPDTTNQRIYTKQINLDGTSSLKTYALIPDSTPSEMTMTQPQATSQELPKGIVMKEEFDKVINEMMNEIQNLKGALNANDESSRPIDAADLKF